MPNKAIHQLPAAGDREDRDLLYIVRGTTDLALEVGAMGPALLQQSVVIPAADVLTLFTTPVLVVDPAPVGTYHYPVTAIIQFSGGTVDYATNTSVVIASTSIVAPGQYALSGDISDRSSPVGFGRQVVSHFAIADSLSLSALVGNPTTGDSDLTVTTYYYRLTP